MQSEIAFDVIGADDVVELSLSNERHRDYGMKKYTRQYPYITCPFRHFYELTHCKEMAVPKILVYFVSEIIWLHVWGVIFWSPLWVYCYIPHWPILSILLNWVLWFIIDDMRYSAKKQADDAIEHWFTSQLITREDMYQ